MGYLKYTGVVRTVTVRSFCRRVTGHGALSRQSSTESTTTCAMFSKRGELCGTATNGWSPVRSTWTSSNSASDTPRAYLQWLRLVLSVKNLNRQRQFALTVGGPKTLAGLCRAVLQRSALCHGSKRSVPLNCSKQAPAGATTPHCFVAWLHMPEDGYPLRQEKSAWFLKSNRTSAWPPQSMHVVCRVCSR